MREPEDVFLKEFMQHPAWASVIESLQILADDYMRFAADSPSNEHDYKRGQWNGVLQALGHIKGLIKSNKQKGNRNNAREYSHRE